MSLLLKIGSSSSIYISSTESAKQKVGTLVIGKNDLIIDKDGIVDLDIGRCSTALRVLIKPLLSQ
jgi:hypothetical protein